MAVILKTQQHVLQSFWSYLSSDRRSVDSSTCWCHRRKVLNRDIDFACDSMSNPPSHPNRKPTSRASQR